ncbi:hypothetical protein BZG36_02164 [Bifiguratus adelaidae]|uniref:Uncharacterized protein n=1 Tax=Bifiguratus adelaidae TaxID=1938954 RepID=A0A261Y0P9_9FUNG|nr:hypothetical protein BZG36_02164 [Bifiguratus adelaidae]
MTFGTSLRLGEDSNKEYLTLQSNQTAWSLSSRRSYRKPLPDFTLDSMPSVDSKDSIYAFGRAPTLPRNSIVEDSIAETLAASVVSSILSDRHWDRNVQIAPLRAPTAAASAPPPHKLREQYRRFLLYLEPAPESAFYYSVERFHEICFEKFGPNNIQQYPPHIALAGPMVIEKATLAKTATDPLIKSKWHLVDELVSFLDEKAQQILPPAVNDTQQLFTPLKSPKVKGLYVSYKPAPSLCFLTRVDDRLALLTQDLRNRFQNEFLVDVKRMDRLDLAYNDQNPISPDELIAMQRLADTVINTSEAAQNRLCWDLVLYEVMVESNVIGVKHQFKRVRQWRLVDPEKHAALQNALTSAATSPSKARTLSRKFSQIAGSLQRNASTKGHNIKRERW